MKPFLLLYMLVFVILSVFPPETSAEDSCLKITEMAVTTKIFRGNPVDSVKRFSSRSYKELYCFTRVESSVEEETYIKHIWYYNGEMTGEYTLPVKGKHWRTYSKKFIEKGSKGTWRIEALDERENLLKSVEFTMN